MIILIFLHDKKQVIMPNQTIKKLEIVEEDER